MNYSEQDKSQLHFEAMLYVLEDPSLDRAAFEARLLDDDGLGEILVEAVQLFHSMRQSEDDRAAPIYLDVSSARTDKGCSSRATGAEVNSAGWLGLAAFAASILVVGFLGWKSMQVFLPSSVKLDNDYAATSPIVPQVFGNAEASLKQVVRAWGEVGTGHHEELLTQYVNLTDFEIALASCDSVCESDVPEWLVMATKAIVQQDDGVDLPFENVDSRTLIQ